MVAKLWVVAVVVVLVASACSGAAGTDTTDASASANGASTESIPGGGDAGADAGDATTTGAGASDRSYFEGNLDQYFLLGTWCDSQGLTWVFTGGDVQVGSDQASLGEAVPIEDIFSEPAATFVVNLGDQFIIEQLGQEVTYTRGSCDGSPAESVTGAGGAEITDSVILCSLLDENKDELATLAGFKARGDQLIGSDDVVYGGSRCSISGRASDYIDVTVFADPALTIELAARAYDDVGAVNELGDGAVYVATADDLTDGVNMTLFPVGDNVVRVESGIAWASIPRDDLIAVSKRIRDILMEAS
jgi:hypothetical protein